MKKLLKNRKGTAEIVGTVLFLVILLFFFSNTFLWYNGVTRQMNMVMGDKMNSAVGLETTVGDGTIEHAQSETIIDGDGISGDLNSTHQANEGDIREIEEYEDELGSHLLSVRYKFNTVIDTPEDMRLITAVRLSVYAQFDDPEDEGCDIFIWDFLDEVWIDAGQRMVKGFRWFNLTFSPPERYMDINGDVMVKFKSEIEGTWTFDGSPDGDAGTLAVDYLEVSAEPVALKLTALGGRDVRLLRIWITEVHYNNHTCIDLEEELEKEIWIPGGSHVYIVFGDENRVDGNEIQIDYKPAPGEVRFKVLTDLGNTATANYETPIT